MRWKVPLSDIDFGSHEQDALKQVLDSGWLSMGQVTQRFEHAFAEMIGVRHAIAVTNGTAALHLTNLALGLGIGDEVILPSLTFVATANAIRYTGAAPVFADVVGSGDLGISPAAIEYAITDRTRAITVMHYGGYLCDMPAVLDIAQRYELEVIEDAAHAPGASLNGRYAGAWGAVACFSFFSNKNLVTGEGGMVTTDNDHLAARIRRLRSHGMTTTTWDRHAGHASTYDVVAMGYNYRIDEMRSALGLVQLEKLEANNTRRRRISARYRKHLSRMDALHLPYVEHTGISAAHLFPILLRPGVDRSMFMDSMKAQGVQTSIHYPPTHHFTEYRERGFALPITQEVASREVSLPLYPGMTAEQVRFVIDAVEEALPIAKRPSRIRTASV